MESEMRIEYLLIAQKVVRNRAGLHFHNVVGKFFVGDLPSHTEDYTLVVRLQGTALDRERLAGIRVYLVDPDGRSVEMSLQALEMHHDTGTIAAWAFAPLPLRFSVFGPHYVRAILGNGQERSLPIQVSRRE